MTANATYVPGNLALLDSTCHAVGRKALPNVPVLPETLLALDLHRQEFSFDLRAISQIILEDPGATLQIFRMAGQRLTESSEQPQRIEDCISELGLEACMAALERGTRARPRDWRKLLDLWQHARQVAHAARQIAEQNTLGIPPDHAYVGGLLHDAGSLPELLGWKSGEYGLNTASNALAIAGQWSLPTCVKDLFCEELLPGWDSQWAELMTAAHHTAGEAAQSSPVSSGCPFTLAI